MSYIGKTIEQMFENSHPAAPKVTHALKKLGDGDMLNGVKNIYNYAMNEGVRKGFVKGSLCTLGICGTIHITKKVGPKCVKYIKNKVNLNEHKKNGEEIYEAFIEANLLEVEENDVSQTDDLDVGVETVENILDESHVL